MSHQILVVDDDTRILELLQMRLESCGHLVETATDGSEALERLRSTPADLVVTDLKMPGMDGLELLRRMRESAPQIPVIFLTAHGSVGDAVEAMKLGAYDFLEKPYRGADLVRMVERALESDGDGSQAPDPAPAGEQLMGTAPAMERVMEVMERVASTPSTVLITGESGTGKELAALTLHRLSARADKAFVIIDCGALPDTLLESELFGHRKGSFTSATQDKRGLLEEADGGTVFLDEIGNISSPMQTRLLRFLQNGEVRRIGDVAPRQVDVRVITATNRDLERATEAGEFREDLYYRLKVVTVQMPPLRDRRGDIPMLAEHFVAEASTTLRRPGRYLAPEAMSLLMAHAWPGNVRELRHVLEAAVALSREAKLEPADFMNAGLQPVVITDAPDGLTALETTEREQIMKALRDNNWVQKRAADALGISGRVIHYKIKKFGIEIPRP